MNKLDFLLKMTEKTEIFISQPGCQMKVVDSSCLSEDPLFYCNLQLQKLSGSPKVSRMVFYFTKKD